MFAPKRRHFFLLRKETFWLASSLTSQILSLSLSLSHTNKQQTKALNDKCIVIPFDYEELKRVLKDRVPDLFAAFDLAPDEAFQALACAAHECLFYSLPKEERGQLLARGFKNKALEGAVLTSDDTSQRNRNGIAIVSQRVRNS